jgi:murein DD-endopeptidase MepM/ murein hydrolase activator NlpD
MELDAKRLDTLQVTLGQLQKRYEQVQTMLGASPAQRTAPAAQPVGSAVPSASAPDTATMTLPTRYPLDARGFVTRGVGSGQEYGATHPGLDIAVPEGTEVRAAGGGLVVEVSETPEYGKMVRLAHPQGYETRYGHLSEIRVRRGDRVSLGAVLGLSGNTGRSTAPHLHFEVRKNDTAVDPMTLIQQPRQ